MFDIVFDIALIEVSLSLRIRGPAVESATVEIVPDAANIVAGGHEIDLTTANSSFRSTNAAVPWGNQGVDPDAMYPAAYWRSAPGRQKSGKTSPSNWL